jgi:hypothetical protein
LVIVETGARTLDVALCGVELLERAQVDESLELIIDLQPIVRFYSVSLN